MMYNCPSCGASLQFDISQQKLRCSHCDRLTDVDEYEERVDAADAEAYDAIRYGCFSCGAEIVTTNESMVSHCAFCGSQNVLSHRISRETRPSHIIPFQRTKEDCMSAYAGYLRRFRFAPRELREAEHLDHFMGLYVPYWLYGAKKKGEISFDGEKATGGRGEYRFYDIYRLSVDVDAAYEGLAFDASAKFSDQMADAIAPFGIQKMRPFSPAVLCGFYADLPGVDQTEFQEVAKSIMEKDVYRRSAAKFSSYKLPSTGSPVVPNIVKLEQDEPECALFPVWFMSFRKKISRKKERVAYAIVNGESGKVAGDVPVDEKRFLLFSLLLSIPVFVLLQMFLTVIPENALFISALMSVAVQLSHVRTIKKIRQKESLQRKAAKERYVREMETQVGSTEKGKDSAGRTLSSFFRGLWSVMIALVVAGYLIYRAGTAIDRMSDSAAQVRPLVLAGIALVLLFFRVARNMLKDISVLGYLALLTSAAVLFIRPVDDVWYYLATLFCYGMIVVMLLGLIRQYNVLATNPVPVYREKLSLLYDEEQRV